MTRLSVFALSIVLYSFLCHRPTDKFQGYRAVQAYEIRPGILAMPKYTSNGEICEIGIQKELYTPELVSIDSTIDQKLLDQVLLELVPTPDRGARIEISGIRNTFDQVGDAVTMTDEYQNVTIRIFARDPAKPNGGDVAASIRWAGRKCM
jgi:hypothetical protein